MTCLPDLNVWLALVVDGHPHHARARRWLEESGDARLVFCRVTEMGLLRLLTNRTVMSGAPLTAAAAWKVLDALLGDPRIAFLKEPANFDASWRRNSNAGKIGPHFWTDAYLSSLCAASGCSLVTFDRALARRHGTSVRLLEAG